MLKTGTNGDESETNDTDFFLPSRPFFGLDPGLGFSDFSRPRCFGKKSQKRVSEEKKVLEDSVFYVSAWVVKTSRLDARHLLFERGALNFVRKIEEFEQD